MKKEYVNLLETKQYEKLVDIISTNKNLSFDDSYALAISQFHLDLHNQSRSTFKKLLSNNYKVLNCLNFLYFIEKKNNNKLFISYLLKIIKIEDYKEILIQQLYSDLIAIKKFYYFEKFYKIILKEKMKKVDCLRIVNHFIKKQEYRLGFITLAHLIRRHKVNKLELFDYLGVIYEKYKKYFLLSKKKQKININQSVLFRSFLNKKNEITHIEEIEKISPRYWRFIDNFDNFLTSEELIKYINDLDSRKSFKIDEKAFVSHKIARIYERAEKFEDAAKFYDNFHDLLPVSKLYVEKLHDRNDQEFNVFRQYVKKCNNKINSKKIFNSKNKDPIFIVGLPRSGSTLISQIIGSHSLTKTLGEVSFFGDTFKYFINIHSTDYSQLLDLNKIDLINFKRIYLLNTFTSGDQYLVDKMLTNFIQIPFIKKIFPNAKIIITERDYKDIALSMYTNYFEGDAMSFSSSFSSIIKYIAFFNKVKNYWFEIYDDLYLINYEKLILDQKSETEKLLNYCGLNYEEQCLNYYESKNVVDTVSFSQARKKIYKNKISYWKNYADIYFKEFNELNLQ